MKVSEMPYNRIDVDKVRDYVLNATQKMVAATSGEEMIKIRNQSIEQLKQVQSMASLCNIRFTLNTQDEFYLNEKNYYDENLPALSALTADFNRAFLNNKNFSEAMKSINPNVAKVYELTLKVMDEKIIDEMVEDSKLITRYDILMSETMFRYRGEEMPLSMLRKYFDDSNRKIRAESMAIAGKGLEKISDELDEIFDKMVKNRTKMAKKMGFSSYAEMGDGLMGRYAYGRNEIKAFRESVKKDIVPVVAKQKEKLAKRLGITDFKLYDNEIAFKCGNPEPIIGAKKMFAEAKAMYHDMGKETGEFIDSMLDADAFDVFPRKGKWGGGYCTSIDSYNQPFILANFNGSSGDIDVLTHEAGHALAYYEFFKQKLDYELNLGTMSVAEIHSMAMEFLAWKYMDKFFGKRADDYRYMHLMSSLTFIPYGTMVDEFQEICYNQPDLTPKQRNEVWARLDREYRPYLSTYGIPYFENGTRWQYQMHIYENPMYYIDYCLSQTVAHEILLKSTNDYDSAFKTYMNIVNVCGEKPFGKLVTDAGLNDPLNGDTLKNVGKQIDLLLDNLVSKL